MSTNLEYNQRFQDAYGANIDKLFWIAGSAENTRLENFLLEIPDDELVELFPKLKGIKFGSRGNENLVDMLLNMDASGLIAEILIPEASNFSYNTDGEPKSWSIQRNISRIGYVYAESLEELMTKIEGLAEKVFDEYVAEDKIKKGKK